MTWFTVNGIKWYLGIEWAGNVFEELSSISVGYTDGQQIILLRLDLFSRKFLASSVSAGDMGGRDSFIIEILIAIKNRWMKENLPKILMSTSLLVLLPNTSWMVHFNTPLLANEVKLSSPIRSLPLNSFCNIN